MIAAVAALAFVVGALLVDRQMTARQHAAERETLIAAALSRSAGEFGGAVAKIGREPDNPGTRPAPEVRPVVGL